MLFNLICLALCLMPPGAVVRAFFSLRLYTRKTGLVTSLKLPYYAAPRP